MGSYATRTYAEPGLDISAIAPNGIPGPPLRRELPLSVLRIFPCEREGDCGGAARRMMPFFTSSGFGVRVHPLAVAATAAHIKGSRRC